MVQIYSYSSPNSCLMAGYPYAKKLMYEKEKENCKYLSIMPFPRNIKEIIKASKRVDARVNAEIMIGFHVK